MKPVTSRYFVSPFAPFSVGAPGSERGRSQERSGESKCIVGGSGRIPANEVSATRKAESWLGEPTKQNADERRARLGRQAVKRSYARP